MYRKKLMTGAGIGAVLIAAAAYAATTTVLGVGVLPYSEVVNGPAEITFRQFTSQPGEVGGWHSHPGAVFNVVTSGTITIEDGCGGEDTYKAGEAFEKLDGRVHRWRNTGNEPETELNTFIVPQGSPLAISLPERRCGPPRNASECRHDGWRAFDYPGRFANQGECVQQVRRSRR